MASKVKDELKKELQKAHKLEESPTKRAILSSLYDKVDELNDDKDIHNFIWANRELPLRMFTNDDFKVMPKIAGIWNGNANTDYVDYDKDFGKNWYNEYENIPTSKIQFIADKYGRDAKQLMKDMGEEATKRRRHDITHDGTPSGYIAQMVAPRSIEDIERGESPSTASIVGDAAQNVLYATPWGRGSQAIAKNSPRLYRILSNPVVQGTVSNATAPVVTEAYDAAVYDDSNPRGTFNWTDVAAGTGTNMVGSALMRGTGAQVQRVFPKAGKKLNEIGTGKSTKEAADEMAKKYSSFKIADADNPAASQSVRDLANEMKTLYSTNPELYALVAGKNAPIWEIAEQPGKNAEEKVISWLAKKNDTCKYNIVTGEGNVISAESADVMIDFMKKVGGVSSPDMRMAQFNPDYKPSPVSTELMRNYDKLNIGNTEMGNNMIKPQSQLISEEALKNYLTNELGNARYEQGKAITRIPVLGPELQSYLDKKATEEAEQKELDDIMKRWYIRLGGK